MPDPGRFPDGGGLDHFSAMRDSDGEQNGICLAKNLSGILSEKSKLDYER